MMQRGRDEWDLLHNLSTFPRLKLNCEHLARFWLLEQKARGGQQTAKQRVEHVISNNCSIVTYIIIYNQLIVYHHHQQETLMQQLMHRGKKNIWFPNMYRSAAVAW